MKKIRLLIADTDSSYMNALVRYIIGTGNQYEVTGYTDTESFGREQNNFALGLLSREFIDEIMKHPEKKKQFGNILYLTDSMNEDSRGFEIIYKFQRMSGFIEQMRGAVNIHMSDNAIEPSVNSSQRIISVYSPMHHELTLPFTLSMARVMGENFQTLFVDMEEISILPQLLERDMKRDLGDYLYHLMGGNTTGNDISEYVGFYDNFYYLPPMKGLSALASVTTDQWETFIRNMMETEFDQIIILMDTMIQGMDEIFQASDDILLLGKPGDYYSYSMKTFMSWLAAEGFEGKYRQMLLPMSARNPAAGSHMWQMQGGNLGRFVRREFANASAAK